MASQFIKEDALITCHGTPLLIGVQDTHGHYRIPLVQTHGQWQPRQPSKCAQATLHKANSIYDLPSTKQATKWLYAVCGYPVKSTWTKAIKASNFHGWPLLTAKHVLKYYPETVKTPKGHLNQTRKNVCSTKPKHPFEELHSTKLHGKKERNIYTKVYDTRETTFTDQTGKFPTRSQAGNQYVMIMVKIDSSTILVEPLKNQKDAKLNHAYTNLMLRLHRAIIQPHRHILDNEISQAMKDLIKDNYYLKYELAPPGSHCCNPAEVAIRNFKSHFLSILVGVAPNFPLQLWDKLLPQAKITLKFLRQSNAIPTISAYAHLCGPFDYNKMPLAPLGCNVQIHEKTDQRGTWTFHSIDGWYISTSPKHYHTHRCHIVSSNSKRLSNTVQFQRTHITNPSLLPHNQLMAAIADLTHTTHGMGSHPARTALHELSSLVHSSTPTDSLAPLALPPSLPCVQPLQRVGEHPVEAQDLLT
eukprot:CCRYP_003191-RB/>CCRYP_003191-RB protein AED:0.38 eAED:0.33 QI:0/-1/0/1/-1/1/1/0/471